ncbi:P-loop containing nucleoside triphosphate hydrolase [Fusarium albosuccineum]|uniref:P-loop containing nucleoside triphosphate hydrolase n=1 Tax=Fusarium albosuccineum TaxID=1237068 RepID=A0A8H4P9I4_9HYPO|nr:P-loop containing nucleoside triphosphate hydrolase [Fusarium albosuccineum]
MSALASQSGVLATNCIPRSQDGLQVHPNRPATFLDVKDDSERRMIETIDKLRELGVQRINPLPQVVVCGAQSSGKSSVLEAITEIPFPRSRQMCTRYVTRVTLAYNFTESVSVTIEPGGSRVGPEKKRLKKFARTESGDQSRERLREYMEEAHRVIFPDEESRDEISDDVLSVKIAGPNKRALQLVDLPGLIEYHQDGSKVVTKIEKMVKEYMAMEQSLVLAIIPATNDLNNAKILKLCEDFDPNGERTLPIITKPDLLPEDEAQDLVNIALGRDPAFSNFSWHVLRNRGTEELNLDTPADERDREENIFFTTVPWNQLDPSGHSIERLRIKLREKYFAAAERELLAMRERIGQLLKDDKYANLSNESTPDKLQHIFKLAVERLKTAAKDHAHGTYNYDTNKLDDGGPVNLRSRIREHDERLCAQLTVKGHTWLPPLDSYVHLSSQDILPTPPSERSGSQERPVDEAVDLATKISEVFDKLGATRGTELARHYNPDTIAKLFWKMSDKWEFIATEYVENVYSCCEAYFKKAIELQFARTEANLRGANGEELDGFLNAPVVAERFLSGYIIPELKKAHKDAKLELWRLEEDRREHVKNLDTRFLVNQRNHRQNMQFRITMGERRQQQSLGKTGVAGANDINDEKLAGQRQQSSLDDFTREQAEMYLHDAQCHYQIARETFIMNVWTQVQERHFLRNIKKLIPDDLDLVDIQELTKEDDETGRAKARLQRDRDDLRKARDALNEWFSRMNAQIGS